MKDRILNFLNRLLISAMVLVIFPLVCSIVLMVLPFAVGEFLVFGSKNIVDYAEKKVDSL